MVHLRRRRSLARWPFIIATALSAVAAAFAWSVFVRPKDVALSDDELREVEAFEEYERRKRIGAV